MRAHQQRPFFSAPSMKMAHKRGSFSGVSASLQAPSSKLGAAAPVFRLGLMGEPPGGWIYKNTGRASISLPGVSGISDVGPPVRGGRRSSGCRDSFVTGIRAETARPSKQMARVEWQR